MWGFEVVDDGGGSYEWGKLQPEENLTDHTLCDGRSNRQYQ